MSEDYPTPSLHNKPILTRIANSLYERDLADRTIGIFTNLCVGRKRKRVVQYGIPTKNHKPALEC